MQPYVVSADIYLLLEQWAEQKGFVLPELEFFHQLREEFSSYMKKIFPNFELVSEDEISSGLTRLVAESDLPVISLDRVYFASNLNFKITRLVNKDGLDRGLGHRGGTPPLAQQIRVLKESGVKEVVLVDDVIFSGALLERVIDLFSGVGIQVPLVCAGIGISEGINRIGSGRGVRCVRTYEKVIDEVCERDFYPGVPLSGRYLAGSENTGIPYLLPFGDPVSWASIPPEWALDFSRFCIEQTVTLFSEIERLSDKPVRCRNLGRKVIELPMDETRYTEVLRKII